MLHDVIMVCQPSLGSFAQSEGSQCIRYIDMIFVSNELLSLSDLMVMALSCN